MAGTNEEQFCVQWNEHQSTLVSVLDTLMKNEILVDCTLAAEGQYLRAHRVVLSACSPTLETLLSQHYSNHPILIFKDLKFSDLKQLVGYMYRGEVDVSQEQLGSFLKAAESLQIKGISEIEGSGANTCNESLQSDSPPFLKLPRLLVDSECAAGRSEDGYNKYQPSRKRKKIRNSNNRVPTADVSNLLCKKSPQFGKIASVKLNGSGKVKSLKPPNLTSPQLVPNSDASQMMPSNGILRRTVKRHLPLLEGDNEYLQENKANNSVEDLTLDDDHNGGQFACESYVTQVPQTSSIFTHGHNEEQFKSKKEFDSMQSGSNEFENHNVLMGFGDGENLFPGVELQCFSCGKIFVSKYNLKRHQRGSNCC